MTWSVCSEHSGDPPGFAVLASVRRFAVQVSGMARDQALREAKIELAKSRGAWRHPYYWAPLVFIGNAAR